MMKHKRLLRLIFVTALIFITAGLGWLLLIQESPAHAVSSDDVILSTALETDDQRPRRQQDIEVVLEEFKDGFDFLVQITNAGDGSGRLFVAEQDGVVKIIQDGEVLATPFLDIEGRVFSQIADGGSPEEGFFSIVFPPDYADDHFYVAYSDTNSDIVISRFFVTDDDPNVADPDSEQIVLTIRHVNAMHHGGQLLFGPKDNYLYISTGDGVQGFFTPQSTESLLGKILRIDVETNDPLTYTIPATNPFTQTETTRDEIWALGLRNPWRFSFDSESGDMYIGDVGNDEREEIDYVPAGVSGLNFGWRCKEGSLDSFDIDKPICQDVVFTDPLFDYPHTTSSDAVIGGFVYRGQRYPDLRGYYFFGDWRGEIWSIHRNPDEPDGHDEVESEGNPGIRITAFGEDEDGELYVIERTGTIWHLADKQGASPDLSESYKLASTPHADPNEEVTYTIHLENSNGLIDETFTLTDTLPAGLTYIDDSLTATQGNVDDSQLPTLNWSGAFSPTPVITITYRVRVTGDVTGTLINKATVTGSNMEPLQLNEAIFVPRPVLTTNEDDFFFPGTQPNQLTDPIPDPSGCSACHTAPIYSQWRGSMMSQAGRDPLLWSALAIANNDAPGAGDYCLRCHTPKGWLEGRSHPADGSNLAAIDLNSGVACEVCHRMVDPVPSTTDSSELIAIDQAIRDQLEIAETMPLTSHQASGAAIIDPVDNRRGPFDIDPDPHPTTLQSSFLGQTSDYVTRSRLCGTCHNVDNPILSWDSERGEYWPNETNQVAPSFDKDDLFPIERTYNEWLQSDYATTGVYAPEFAGAKADGLVGACQDCHMPRSTGQAAGAGVDRDCETTGCLPVHELVGGNSWVPQILQDTRWRLNAANQADLLDETTTQARSMLQSSATLTATLTLYGNIKVVNVRVTNETGHKLPTGYPEGRRMWLNVRAYDNNDTLLYESGAYNENSGVLTIDDQIKIYETKQGLSEELATLLNLPAGESFHFVLNNQVVKDNRIPPRGFSQAALNERGLKPVGASYAPGQYWDHTAYSVPVDTERVDVTFYYQTSSKEYIDFLRNNGGVDGEVLGQLWDDSKSPPEVVTSVSIQKTLIGSLNYLPIILK